MNKLFKNGEYVLLEDCKAFDEKYGLKEGETMWAVAIKMQDGEPNCVYMDRLKSNICVGINGDVGLWTELVKTSYATKLSVEDVLYRSEDGLTLDELREIPGAFEDGKEYKCVEGDERAFTFGGIYFANGNGVLDDHGDDVKFGRISKFKPVTTKAEWVPSVGDEVMTSTGKYKIELPVDSDGMTVISDNGAWIIQDSSGCKPINQERERVIKKVTDLSETLDDSYSPRDFAIALYDAGMLKR